LAFVAPFSPNAADGRILVRRAFETRYIPLAFAYPSFARSGFMGEVGAPRTTSPPSAFVSEGAGMVVRQVFLPGRIEEPAVAADRWLQERCAEYGKTGTYFR
jgi:hypothetical protein